MIEDDHKSFLRRLAEKRRKEGAAKALASRRENMAADLYILARERQGTPSIYFIHAEMVGLVKIGTAVNLRARYSEIRTASPIPLNLIAIAPGGRDQEQYAHKMFEELRSHGEWFHLSPELLRFIRSQCLGPCLLPASYTCTEIVPNKTPAEFSEATSV